MYGAGIPRSCEIHFISEMGYIVDSDPGLWRKKSERSEMARVRRPGYGHHTPTFQDLQGPRTVLTTTYKVSSGKSARVLVSEKKVKIPSQLATEKAETATPRLKISTETVADAVNSVPVVDAQGHSYRLPLKVSQGLVLENLGVLYEGRNGNKYWRTSRCGHHYPYPVGYVATKTYKGAQYRQTIEAGPDGPIFVVGEVDKASHAAESPSKAWALALTDFPVSVARRVHGPKHFGFDCPLVLELLMRMEKDQLVKIEVVENSTFNEERVKVKTREKHGLEWKGDFYGKRNIESSVHDNSHPVPSVYKNNGQQPELDEPVPSTQMSESLTWKQVPGSSMFGGLVRLRSDLTRDTIHQKVPILSCLGQQMDPLRIENEYPGEASGSLDQMESPSKNLLQSQPHVSPPANRIAAQGISAIHAYSDSLGDEELPHTDEEDRSLGNIAWKPSGRNTGETVVFRQKSSHIRLLNSPIHRSRISLEDSPSTDTRRLPGHARSLANLLEDWSKGGKSQSTSNKKLLRRSPEHNISHLSLPLGKVEKEEDRKQELVAGANVLIHEAGLTSEDMQMMVEEWGSGEEARSSVLMRIQNLALNLCVDEALRILEKLHSNGFDLDDTVYSIFFPFTFDDWQSRAAQLVKEKSVLLCAHGGAGKFTVAARCLYEALVQGSRCLFVTPYETLANQYLQRFQVLFGEKRVSNLSKQIDGWSHCGITVVTLENLVKELREGRFSKYSSGDYVLSGSSIAVLDRFHTIGDDGYGNLWEEVIMLLDHQVKVFALSLPIQSPQDISCWIRSVHGPCEVVTCETDPVPRMHYFCDISGLQLLGRSDREELLNTSQIPGSENCSTLKSYSSNDLQTSIRVLLHSLQTEKLLPLAIVFSSVHDCIESFKDASQVMQGDVISAKDIKCIERRVENLFTENAGIERMVRKEDIRNLLHGFTVFHEGLLPLWLEFTQGLIHDNLVRIVFATNSMLAKSGIRACTVALSSISSELEARETPQLSSELVSLLGKAGRRGLDSQGNVVFLGSNQMGHKEVAVIHSRPALRIHSHFHPSYSLLLNLLNRHTILEVRNLVESNYGDYLARRLLEEELKELEGEIWVTEKGKQDLHAKMVEMSNKINAVKLQDATIFTQVDVRVPNSGHPFGDDIQPGLLYAVLPGPSELLYMILCADNSFRLLPCGALDHVYTEERRLDILYENVTGNPLQAPAVPSKENWKITPGDYLAFICEGTPESARVVEVLLHYGFKSHRTQEELRFKEEIRFCNELLSALRHQQELMLLSKETPSTAWTRSEKLIEVLLKSDALERIASNTSYLKLKALGILISKLHHVENELWYAMVLSSSVVKPLTAPELGAICSALVSVNGEIGSGTWPESSKSFVYDTPKRLRVALEKLEKLRKKAEILQGSDIPPLRLNGSAMATIHWLGRETVWQDPVDDLKDWMVLLVQQTVKLLCLVDDVWAQNTDAFCDLGATSGLHNLARRAAHLLGKVIVSVK